MLFNRAIVRLGHLRRYTFKELRDATDHFNAPEYLSTGDKTDVFGFGILLLELITGHCAAVHSGANCLGYKDEGQGFMVGVQITPVEGLPAGFPVISPVEVVGYVVVVDQLLSVQNKSYSRPTLLVAKSVKGEEEIPDGAVAVLTPDMPDVLSHVSVRARNSKMQSSGMPWPGDEGAERWEQTWMIIKKVWASGMRGRTSVQEK
ncbi:alpha-glucan, water dikinase [Salvia divinorum]|uniref:Alpha-glucan, water dikinase n=1 Tax=Salvia divinorum TaxID=28513 RepID=A0ABD1IA23_SALDI